jgi:hypothetical protein
MLSFMTVHWRASLVLLSLSLSGCQGVTGSPSAASEQRAKEVATNAAEATKPAAEPAAPAEAATAHADEGCIHGKVAHEGCGGDGAAAPATGTGHFGSPFVASTQVPLGAAVVQMTKTPSEDAMLVTGEVTSVCQAKGCWMVLRDRENAEVEARVIMKNHAFAVPFDGKGKTAKVEGVLTSRTFTAAQVKHLAKDAGANPTDVEAKPRTEWVLTATGVELTG